MKAFSLAFLAVALCAMTLVGCEDHDGKNTVYVDVPDPIVTNTDIHTPHGLTIVEVVDPNGLLTNPASGVTQDLINKELDYQVLYVWANEESGEFTQQQLLNFVNSARFHLVLDCKFKVNKDRNVHYTVIPAGNDIYLATERLDKQGHRCAPADRAMDLYSNDVNEGGDLSVTPFAVGTYPTSMTFPGGWLQ